MRREAGAAASQRHELRDDRGDSGRTEATLPRLCPAPSPRGRLCTVAPDPAAPLGQAVMAGGSVSPGVRGGCPVRERLRTADGTAGLRRRRREASSRWLHFIVGLSFILISHFQLSFVFQKVIFELPLLGPLGMLSETQSPVFSALTHVSGAGLGTRLCNPRQGQHCAPPAAAASWRFLLAKTEPGDAA